MTREAFRKNLSEAARGIIGATRKYVEEHLPNEARFLVLPNCSFDGNPLEDDEEVFPQETLPEWTTLPPKTCDQAVDHLFRGGKVPVWINVYVDLADNDFSYLLLECCGRFTAMEKHLYRVAGGRPPFNPQIPLPTLKYDLKRHGKFHLRSRYNVSEKGDPANAAPPHS